MAKWTPRKIQCIVCNKEFMSHHQAVKMCSDECRKLRKKESTGYVRARKKAKAYRNKRPLKTCELCGKLLPSNHQVVHEECMEKVMMSEYPKLLSSKLSAEESVTLNADDIPA